MIKVFKTFYKFLAKKKFWLAVFWVLLIISPIVSSLPPYFYKLLVDNIPNLQVDKLTNILLVFIGVKFLDVLLNSLKYLIGDVVSIDAMADVYSTVFKHIHQLDFSYHTKKSSGSLISAMRRGESAFWNLFHSGHFRIVDVIVRFIVMAYFFANINKSIFTLTLFSFLLSIVISFLFVKFNIKFRKVVNQKDDEISSVVVDNMINFETVKLFAKEAWEQKRLSNIYFHWKKAVWNYAYTFRGLDISLGTVINISTYFILVYALNLTLKGVLTLGDFVLIAAFVQTFFGHLFELIWGIRDIAKSYSDIERFFGILDNEIEIKNPDNPVKLQSVKGEIMFKDVTFTYEKGNKNAVKNINLRIRQGQSIALVGKSGSGKTTLTKLLLRFFDVDKGKISIDGVDIKSLSKEDLRSHFGVVPQEPILFNNTVKYNIAYGRPDASMKEIIAASKMANIHKFITSLPAKYNTEVGERGIKLSGGQKQRLAIARMILSDPKIIIFDEATSQLDSVSERLIQNAFWNASKDKTTLIIAHRLSTIQKADKIVVMEKGNIVEEGSHQSLIANKESLYAHFWKLQIKHT